MRTLLEEDLALESPGYGPDPVMMKKKGQPNLSRDITDFKKKIRDKKYMDHAINRIAMELMHFLAR
ncbi:MAG: hypothetical protein RIF32_06590 [Leptospirales bacterium]|nr:hypothetical protein [bacterium]